MQADKATLTGSYLAVSASLKVVYSKTLQEWLDSIEYQLDELIQLARNNSYDDDVQEKVVNAAGRFLKFKERLKVETLSLEQKFKEASALVWWLEPPQCSIHHYLGFIKTQYYRVNDEVTNDKIELHRVCCLVFLDPSIATLANQYGTVVLVKGVELDRLKPLCGSKSAIAAVRKGQKVIVARVIPNDVVVAPHTTYSTRIYPNQPKVTIEDFPATWPPN